MISTMYIFPNDAVAVCNDKGQQIPSLQGSYQERKQILMYLMKKFPEIEVNGDINQQRKTTIPEWNFWFPFLMKFLELYY